MSFARKMATYLRNKYSQKLLDNAKKIYNGYQKNQEFKASGNLISNKTADKTTIVSKKSSKKITFRGVALTK